MTPAEIQVKISFLQREATYWQNLIKNKSCNDCAHFERAPICGLANQAPPPEVQKTGCPSWKWDNIPY